MKKYSAFAVAREALRHHTGWNRAWRDAQPKNRYDVVIIGAGLSGGTRRANLRRDTGKSGKRYLSLDPTHLLKGHQHATC